MLEKQHQDCTVADLVVVAGELVNTDSARLPLGFGQYMPFVVFYIGAILRCHRIHRTHIEPGLSGAEGVDTLEYREVPLLSVLGDGAVVLAAVDAAAAGATLVSVEAALSELVVALVPDVDDPQPAIIDTVIAEIIRIDISFSVLFFI